MWQVWVSFWASAGLASHSMWVAYFTSPLSEFAVGNRPSFPGPFVVSDESPRCPACGDALNNVTSSPDPEVALRWACCNQCGVCLIFSPAVNGAGKHATRCTANLKDSGPGFRTRR